MQNNNEAEFLSKVSGYVSPVGPHFDPVGKEGLAHIAAESFKFGSKQTPNSLDLFRKLENLGAVFATAYNSNSFYVYISSPRENIIEAQEVLDEIFKDVSTTEESLEKIKTSTLMKIDELKSDDRSYAVSEFKKLVAKERDILGTKESIKSITLEDVELKQKELIKNSFKLEISKADSYDKLGDIKIDSDSNDFKQENQNRYLFLPRDMEQKVITVGYRIGGLNNYNYATRQVSMAILSSGLVGLVIESIREDNSAAYYAYANLGLMNDKGYVGMTAGISEENTTKVIGLMRDIYSNIAVGDFDEKRIEIAKNSVKGQIERAFDGVTSLFAFSSSWYLRGLEVPKYDDLIKSIDAVTKEEIVDFYKDLSVGKEDFLVINGKLSKEVSDECKILFK